MKNRGKFLLLFAIIFLILISLTFISAASYSVDVTYEHPFLLSNGTYVAAKDLQVGYQLKTINGKTIKISEKSFQVLDKPVSVYNLEMPLYSDYILPGGVVVHNSGTIKDLEIRLNKGKSSWTSEEINRVNGAQEFLRNNNLPKLTTSQEIELLLAHNDPVKISKVWRLRDAGLSVEQIKKLGNKYFFGDLALERVEFIENTLCLSKKDANLLLSGENIWANTKTAEFDMDFFLKVENDKLIAGVFWVKSIKGQGAGISACINFQKNAIAVAKKLGLKEVEMWGLEEHNKDLFCLLRKRGFQNGDLTIGFLGDEPIPIPGVFKKIPVN